MRNVINIVNFIRGFDPRADFDLKEPVFEQLRLSKKYNLPTTFLYQYDALIQPEFTDILKNEQGVELGVWIENSVWLTEKVGLVWRGRFDWDWSSNVDMTVGYTLNERKLLIDEIMRKFKEIFGYYPKSVGSWALDAYSVNYMKNKYDIDAVLICKEQWGTDGYSLWGGYYDGAYFPCKNNILCPAQTDDEQINVPVFRMLGSDPIDQYMNGIGTNWQNVETMEPVYPSSGSDEQWVSWYLNERFNNKNNLGLNYCQAGQENAFGWHTMKKGYEMQMQIFDQKNKNGEIDFEFVSETGRKYKDMYSSTPCTAIDAHKENRSSLWFNSKYYRANLYYADGMFMLRDMFIFNELYRERYFDKVAESSDLYLDTLPFIDCFRWSRENEIGGVYFKSGNKIINAISDFKTTRISDTSIYTETETEIGKIQITFNEKNIIFELPKENCILEAIVYTRNAPVSDFKDGKIQCRYENFNYEITLNNAELKLTESGYVIKPFNKTFEIIF